MSKKITDIGFLISINLLIACIVLFVLDSLNTISIRAFLDLEILVLITIVLLSCSSYFKFKEYENSNQVYFALFLISLISFWIIKVNMISTLIESFLFICAIASGALFVNTRVETMKSEKKYSKLTLFLSLGILSIAILLYIYNYFQNYNYFFGGEFHSFFAVKGILATGLPEMLSGVIYLRNIAYHYYISIFSFLFGHDKIAFKIGILVPFLFSLFVAYKLGNKLSKNKILGGIFPILLLLSSTWIFTVMSVQTRFFSFALSFFLITFFLTANYFSNKTKLNFAAMFLAIVLCLFLESIAVTILYFYGMFMLFEGFKISKRRMFEAGMLILLLLIAAFSITFPKEVNLPQSVLESDDLEPTSQQYIDILNSSLGALSFNSFFLNFLYENTTMILLFYLIGLTTIRIKEKTKLIFYSYFFLMILFFSSISFVKTQPRLIAYFLLFMIVPAGITLVDIIQNIRVGQKTRSAIYGLLAVALLMGVGGNTYANYNLASNGDGYVLYDITETSGYVNDNYQEGDIIISTLVWGWDNKVLDSKINYTLRTRNYEKVRIIIETPENYHLLYHTAEVITDQELFFEVLENNSRVWIIEHYRSGENNVNQINDFLNEQKDNIVYETNDVSRVYLFTKD